MPDTPQNYQNHVHRPFPFVIVALVLFISVIGASVNLYESLGDHQRLYSASLILVLAACSLATLWIARTSALRAQDRAVHAQESLRYFIATGKPIDPRLTLRQIIALRFASDVEYLDLAQRAATQGLSSDDIKKAVKNWRADTYRV